jgi:ribosomal protein L37AE/L43A
MIDDKPHLVGAFEQVPEVQAVTGECPECESPDIYARWRDAVWDETEYACRKCNHVWIKS